MVATDADVMGWVEQQLRDNPGVTVDELFEGAKVLNADVAELNKRQFHARYPLQIKRRASRAAAAAAAPVVAETPPPAPAPAPAPARGGPNTDTDVMRWVEGELRNNPAVTVDELLVGAIKMNAAIADLTKRQFHARYPLQVKRAASRAAEAASPAKPQRRRRRAPAAPKAKPAPPPAKVREPSAATGIDRKAVRSMLFDFAADVTAAEGTLGVVRVLAAMDDYIDRIA